MITANSTSDNDNNSIHSATSDVGNNSCDNS